MDTTILLCTDNSCPPEIFDAVKRNLAEVASDIRIVVVSHTPVNFGDNIVVGKQKRSWLTLYRQLEEGLKYIDTRFVHIAEHDCLYTRDHFLWEPPTDELYYYNENVWLGQWSNDHNSDLNGMYSMWNKLPRLALSQLVCNSGLYQQTIKNRLDHLDKQRWMVKHIAHIGEPGVSKLKQIEQAEKWASSGRPVYLKSFLDEVLELEHYKTFKTEFPNIDIRHGGNFTGPRRGRQRRYHLPYWGKLEDHIKEVVNG